MTRGEGGVMSELLCVRCGKRPVLHEFICAECIYDDYTRAMNERDALRAAAKNLSDTVEIILALARQEGVDVEAWGSAHEMLKLTAAQMRIALKAEGEEK